MTLQDQRSAIDHVERGRDGAEVLSGDLESRPHQDDLAVVGRRLTRVDALEKLSGQAKFTGDHVLPGMLHAAPVTTSYPHGRIRGIDTSRARALSGVIAVVGAGDVVATGCVSPMFGPVVRDREVFPRDVIRFAGEPVALVVAKTRAIARAAAKLVEVDVEELPAVTDIDQALAAGAPLVHQAEHADSAGIYAPPAELEYGETNAVMSFELSRGDAVEAMATADHVVETTFSFPAVYHYAMEPFCVLADATDRYISVWSSAQHPSQVQADIARMWGRPLSRVRVVAPYLGGGFGSKSFTHVEPMVVAASLSLGAPVRLELSVEESMKVSRRHSMRGTARAAVSSAGLITAVDAEMAFDGGAYALMGPIVVGNAASRMLGGYVFDNYRIRTRLVYTHTSPAGSFRAIGGVQGVWAMESLLASVAAHDGCGVADLRERHVAYRGQEIRAGRTPIDADIRESLEAVERMSERAADEVAGPAGPYWMRGHGAALGVSDPGASPVSTAIVRLMSDGSVVASVGSSEMGQGVRTVIAQVVAETIGVELDRVHVQGTDTGSGPYDASTGASRSSVMSGLAAQRAADSVLDRVLSHVAERTGTDRSSLGTSGGEVVLPDGARYPMSKVVREVFGAAGGNLIGVGEVTRRDFPTRPAFYEIAAGFADVAVDAGTGEVRVLAYGSCSDVGRVINPMTMEGQEEGAVVQGVGHTLFEEMIWDDGQPVTESLVNYRVPRSSDIPEWFATTAIENLDGPGPFGIKGGGEGPILPVAGAIANALFDATGIQFRDLPLTPERVWRTLARAGAAPNYADTSSGPASGGGGRRVEL